MDWDDDNTGYGNPWYFRGVFQYSKPSGGQVAKGQPLVVLSGPDICDKMTVWIAEFYNGVLRAAPTYTHTNITNSTQFAINGTLLGVYTNRLIGTTINDAGLNCAFAGSHVHEDDVGVNGAVTTTRHTSLYPTGVSCHTPCGTFRNDNINNWTRKFSWNEGA